MKMNNVELMKGFPSFVEFAVVNGCHSKVKVKKAMSDSLSMRTWRAKKHIMRRYLTLNV